MSDELRKLLQEEFKTASVDLKQQSAYDPVIRFYDRHDKKLGDAINTSVTKLACGVGCWYCCYYKVVASPIEVFAIVKYVKQKFQPLERQRILEEARMNVLQVKGMTQQEHLETNQKCPFLVEQKCSIYPVRPSKCRNCHASNVDYCKESYERPTDFSIPNSYITEIYTIGNASSTGFEYAVAKHGLDSRAYDLNAAFVEAMENPNRQKRYRDGKKAFLDAKFEEIVPYKSSSKSEH